jgi:effector-binding domain-containing protein
MKTISILPALLSVFPFVLPAYEEAIARTQKGTVEVKTVPELTVIEVREESGGYFDEDNKMFRKLFRYISDKDIAMTTPVTVDVKPGAMRFIVSKSDLEKADENTSDVSVITIPERTVVSIGYNGSYSEENYEKHLKLLQAWLEKHEDEWVADGDPIGVYWDGPFKLSAWKKAEVMIPVRKVEEGKEVEE